MALTSAVLVGSARRPSEPTKFGPLAGAPSALGNCPPGKTYRSLRRSAQASAISKPTGAEENCNRGVTHSLVFSVAPGSVIGLCASRFRLSALSSYRPASCEEPCQPNAHESERRGFWNGHRLSRFANRRKGTWRVGNEGGKKRALVELSRARSLRARPTI